MHNAKCGYGLEKGGSKAERMVTRATKWYFPTNMLSFRLEKKKSNYQNDTFGTFIVLRIPRNCHSSGHHGV